ncbi:MAG: GNAT family N-acetyltransferase [archaeon]|nr:GNAT family N-acetyltransferase [archaeon]
MLERIGKDQAEDFRTFLHPIWMEVFTPMISGGAEMTEYFFQTWLSVPEMHRAMDEGYDFGFFTVDGKKVGVYSTLKEGERLYLSKVYVHGDYRGKGYGSMLIQELFEHGREQGCTKAYLHVNIANEKAIKAYERNGMHKAYRLIKSQGNGFATNDYVMERGL